jgi:hypothetical protein
MARGKKIDTWKVTHEGVTVEVPVFMFKGDDYDRRKNFFQAEIKEYDISGSDTDIDKLRVYLESEFRKRLSVDWKPMLRVCFGGSIQPIIGRHHDEEHVRQQSDSKLKMRVERLYVGADFMGNTVYCDNDDEPGNEGYFGKSNVHKGAPDVGVVDTEWWSSGGRRGNDGVAALIPDTEVNRVAVQRIIEGMENLLERMRGFLCPDQIETTLALVSRNMLLLSGSTGEAESQTSPSDT